MHVNQNTFLDKLKKSKALQIIGAIVLIYCIGFALNTIHGFGFEEVIAIAILFSFFGWFLGQKTMGSGLGGAILCFFLGPLGVIILLTNQDTKHTSPDRIHEKCSSCGKSYPAQSAKFCPNCGKEVH